MSAFPQAFDTQTIETNKKDDLEAEYAIIEQVAVQGDLSKLTPKQRVLYFNKVCGSMGLNPLTKPLDYINLNGKLVLYATKNCAEQLRKINGISIYKLEGKLVDDLYIVTAGARSSDGRTDEASGAVTIGNLKGDAKANAIMKAETKAKRRVTLSIAGMGFLDESEVETIPGAKIADFNPSTGEIKDEVKPVIEFNPKISQDEIDELEMILNECDEKYVDVLLRRLNAEYKVDKLSNIPMNLYSRVKDAATKNMEKNHASQREKTRLEAGE